MFKYCFVDITGSVDFLPMPCQMFGYLLFRSGTSSRLLQLTSSIYQYIYVYYKLRNKRNNIYISLTNKQNHKSISCDFHLFSPSGVEETSAGNNSLLSYFLKLHRLRRAKLITCQKTIKGQGRVLPLRYMYPALTVFSWRFLGIVSPINTHVI